MFNRSRTTKVITFKLEMTCDTMEEYDNLIATAHEAMLHWGQIAGVAYQPR